MEWRRTPVLALATAALIIPATMAGCDAGETTPSGPPDLPAPVATAFQDPGSVAVQVVPRSHDLHGFALERTGQFAVTAELDPDVVGARIALLPWSDEEERWSEPEALEFSEPGFGDGAPALAPDASYLLFESARPTDNPGAADINIWVAQREDGPDGEVGWTDPWLLPAVHSPAWDGAPSLAGDGSLYFASEREGPASGKSLYVAPFEDGMWTAPRKLPDGVNTFADDSDPFVAPDQSFIVFASNRDGPWNLFVTFAEGEGWGDPRPLSEAVNSDGDDRAPYLSAAGSTLFWIRDGELMAAPAGATGLDHPEQESEVAATAAEVD